MNRPGAAFRSFPRTRGQGQLPSPAAINGAPAPTIRLSGPVLVLNRPDRLGHDRHRPIAHWDLRGVACVDHLLGFLAYATGSGLALEPGCHRQLR
jgi:hypothetical protein